MFENIQITVDVSDPDRLAEFWAEALDYEVQSLGDDSTGNYQGIVDPSGKRPGMVFQRVPEPKTVKNRVHIDCPTTRTRPCPLTSAATNSLRFSKGLLRQAPAGRVREAEATSSGS